MTGERVLSEMEVVEHGHINGTEGMEMETRKSSMDSCGSGLGLSGQPTSKTLLIELANDYSQYLKTDLSLQITKVEEFVLESVAKMDEFRSLYEMKEGERKGWTTHVMPDLIRTGTLLSITLNQRLDTLSCLILSMQSALDTLELLISQAEMNVGLVSNSSTSTAIRSVFKYFYKAEEMGSDQSLSRSKSQKASSVVTYRQLLGPDPLGLSQFFH